MMHCVTLVRNLWLLTVNKLILALLLSITSIPSFACKDSLAFTPDKQKHLALSAGIGFTSELYFGDKTKAFVASTLATASKEVYDGVSGKGCASVNDMIYNVVGAGIGIYTGSWFISPNKIVYFKEF